MRPFSRTASCAAALALSAAFLFPQTGVAAAAKATAKDPAAASAEAEAKKQANAAALERAIALAAEAEPLMAGLRKTQEKIKLAVADYDPARIEPLLGERLAQREKLKAVAEELNSLEAALKYARQEEEIGMWVNMFGGKVGWGEVVDTQAARVKYREARRAERNAFGALENDEMQFKLVLEELERQKRLAAERAWRVKAGLIGLLLLSVLGGLGGALYAIWKKQKKLETMHAGTGPVPALPGQAAPADALGGNYRIERELARGAMGVVFEAVDLTLGRKVAVKKMREELRASPKDLELFLAEARTVAGFKHAHIVDIHTVFQENGEIYLVFEFVSGRSLSQALAENGVFSWPQALELVSQIGSALDYAHERKVIHRDLKPANVMLTAAGQAKVMDFGIAHRVSQSAAKSASAAAWGTLPYMAPEQEQGTVSRQSDVYALAVCLYEMTTGKLPFPGPEYLAQKRACAYAPPSQAASGLPAGLDGVLKRAFSVDPAQRHPSAGEFTAALRALA